MDQKNAPVHRLVHRFWNVAENFPQLRLLTLLIGGPCCPICNPPALCALSPFPCVLSLPSRPLSEMERGRERVGDARTGGYLRYGLVYKVLGML
jgi:hypothetical protein